MLVVRTSADDMLKPIDIRYERKILSVRERERNSPCVFVVLTIGRQGTIDTLNLIQTMVLFWQNWSLTRNHMSRLN